MIVMATGVLFFLAVTANLLAAWTDRSLRNTNDFIQSNICSTQMYMTQTDQNKVWPSEDVMFVSCRIKVQYEQFLCTYVLTGPFPRLSMFLQSYDNGDSQLDSSELLKFIQQNDSVVELQSYADQESNKLLRSVLVWGNCYCLHYFILCPYFTSLQTLWIFSSVAMLAHTDPCLCTAVLF